MKEMLVLTVRQARRRGILVAALIALSTGGCSSVPDAVNPVEWYKGTRDWVSGDDKAATAKPPEAKPVPGAEKAFPKLDSVPERPPQSTSAEREKMANSLIADRDTARYTDEQFRRQDSSIAAKALPQAASVSPVPAPKPAPTPAPAPAASSQAMVQQETSPPVAAPASPVAAPVANSTPPLPVIPNQPIPVIPNQTPPTVALPPPPQPAQLPAVPSIAPPPLPALVGSSAPPPDAFPPRPLDIPERPPVVNPSGGGPAYTPPTPPAQQDGLSFEANRFASRFPNEAGAPQRPLIESPVFETAQPNSPPVATILFADGSARIGGGDREVIRRVYDEYRRRGGRIRIVGHASSRTRNLDQASHQLANFSISYERARSVAGMLERLGVPPEIIVVTAMSDQDPAYFEVMPAGEAGNRRVAIFFEN